MYSIRTVDKNEKSSHNSFIGYNKYKDTHINKKAVNERI